MLDMEHKKSPVAASGGRAGHADAYPALSTDVVVFRIHEQRLELLLIRRGEAPFRADWALPGGFVEMDEDLRDAAARELLEETGVRGVYLEQLYSFGRPDRDPRGRVVSVAYYALLPEARWVAPRAAASDAREAAWFACRALPALAFDHAQIIEAARRRLCSKLEYSSIALQFLPKEFTLAELQRVYEAILERPLDKRNFRRRLSAGGLLRSTGRNAPGGRHRPARLYTAQVPGAVEYWK